MLDFGCTDLARSVARLAWGMYTLPGEAAQARERRERTPGVGPPVTPWKGETPQIFLEAPRREMELSCVCRAPAGPRRASIQARGGRWSQARAAEPLGRILSGSGVINNDTVVVISTHVS